MMTHTKGPWHVREGMERAPQRVFDSDGGLVAEAHSLRETVSERLTEAQANARLIAAAPDLLEALRVVVDYYVPEFVKAPEAVAAHEAIAKATAGFRPNTKE